MPSDVRSTDQKAPNWHERQDLWHKDWDAASPRGIATIVGRRTAINPTHHYVVLVNAGRSEPYGRSYPAFSSVPSRGPIEEAMRRLSYHCKVVDRHPLDWEEHIDASDPERSAIEDFAIALTHAAFARATEDLRSEFTSLSQLWKEETAGDSVGASILTHHAYQRIIGMGKPALPLILEDMAKQGGHWFAALRAISGQDPVAHDDRGRVRKMQSTWLDWGRREGIIT